MLPNGVWSWFEPGETAVSWLTVASSLLSVRLVQLWGRRARDSSSNTHELVALSFALVALAVLDALPRRSVYLTWNLAVLLGLTVPLTLLALVDDQGGVRNLRVPALLRIDRI